MCQPHGCLFGALTHKVATGYAVVPASFADSACRISHLPLSVLFLFIFYLFHSRAMVSYVNSEQSKISKCQLQVFCFFYILSLTVVFQSALTLVLLSVPECLIFSASPNSNNAIQ